jgi:putative lysine transport system substrate-binding protein
MIDGYVSERPGAISASVTNPNLTYIVFNEGEGFDYSVDDGAIAVGLRQGSELQSQINEILAGISEEERQSFMEDAIRNQPAVN